MKITTKQLKKLIKEALEGDSKNIRINIVVEIDAEDLEADTDDFKIGTLSAKLDEVISIIGLEDQLMQEFTDINGVPVAIRSVTVEGM